MAPTDGPPRSSGHPRGDGEGRDRAKRDADPARRALSRSAARAESGRRGRGAGARVGSRGRVRKRPLRGALPSRRGAGVFFSGHIRFLRIINVHAESHERIFSIGPGVAGVARGGSEQIECGSLRGAPTLSPSLSSSPPSCPDARSRGPRGSPADPVRGCTVDRGGSGPVRAGAQEGPRRSKARHRREPRGDKPGLPAGVRPLPCPERRRLARCHLAARVGIDGRGVTLLDVADNQ